MKKFLALLLAALMVLAMFTACATGRNGFKRKEQKPWHTTGPGMRPYGC